MAEAVAFGEISLETLRRSPETEWFQLGYDLFSFGDGENYRRLLAAQPGFGSLEISAFIGTWCPDCQEHLPGFARILDAVKFPAARFHLYNLDRGKTFPGGQERIARNAVKKLPTFIFSRDGKEIGRITETPEHSLLRDLAEILT